MSEQPKYRVEIFWSDNDDGYIADIPELTYCSAFGETREEALHEVLIAEELHLETLEELGRPIPNARVWHAEEDASLPETTQTSSVADESEVDPIYINVLYSFSHGSGLRIGSFGKRVEDQESRPYGRVVDDESLRKLALN